MNRVTPAVVEELRRIAGPANVFTLREQMEPYAHDETEDLVFYPEVVVEPAAADAIPAIMKLATRERIPVTPRAAGTGLSGGALPVCGGILLSVKKLNRILEIDVENLFVVVEPGVITQVLQEAVEKVGLYYPPDPASKGSCMIGGNIAECAGGPRALKYGVTKDYVYGLDVVLPGGDVVRTGGKLLKNVTGYNLTQLFVGSEGTLGVVTKIILKLIPLPRHRKTMLAPFNDIRDAARAVSRIFQAGVVPCCCEYMERDVVKAAERHKGIAFPHSDAAALLLIEVDGNDPGVLDRDIATIGEVCMQNGSPDLFLAEDAAKQKFLWDMRRSLGEAVRHNTIYKEEDTVVPRARLPELVVAIREVMAKHHLEAMAYGHIGDGNIHVNILKRDMPDAAWNTQVPVAVKELFERVVALGGQISGEHGVGYVQRNYLPIAFTPAEIEALRAVKRAFDPLGIMNPMKALPDPA